MIRKYIIVLSVLLTSAALVPLQASERGFQEALTGTAVLGDGTQVEVNFPIAFEENDGIWYFRAGRQQIAMSSPPQQYNIQLAVQEQDSMVYIAEFANRYMRNFNVQIADHNLELVRGGLNIRYGLRLRVDDRLMMFERRTPVISITMDDHGITGVRTDGFVRDLSSRRVE